MFRFGEGIARFVLAEEPRLSSELSITVAESFRRSLRCVSPTIIGKDSSSLPRRDDHRHAYFLPTDEDGDGSLDHVTVYASESFAPEVCDAFAKLRSIEVGRATIDVALVTLDREGAVTTPLHGPAVSWVSCTPYVCTRFPKKRTDEEPSLGLARDIAEEVARWISRGTREGVRLVGAQPIVDERGRFSIVPSAWANVSSGRTVATCGSFRRRRARTSDDGAWRPFGSFRLEFSDSVRGPLALGHSSHFGLGLFLPASNRPAPEISAWS